jgi:hypothetical protein
MSSYDTPEIRTRGIQEGRAPLPRAQVRFKTLKVRNILTGTRPRTNVQSRRGCAYQADLITVVHYKGLAWWLMQAAAVAAAATKLQRHGAWGGQGLPKAGQLVLNVEGTSYLETFRLSYRLQGGSHCSPLLAWTARNMS